MASSITFTSNSYEGRRLRLYITQTKNIASNTSTLNWTLYSEGGEAKYYSVYETTIKINGTQVYHVGGTSWSTYKFPAAAGSTSGSITVSHNSAGDLSVPVYFYTAVYTSAGKKDYGGTFDLDSIPRQASITGAPDFTDEDSPRITYSNQAGNSVESLQACISFTGANDDITYRDISKTGTSYTFSLTSAERATLRKSITSGSSRTVKFYVRTKIGGVNYYSSLTRTLSLVNYTPTLSPVVEDTLAAAIALTGDKNTIIKGYNKVSVVSNASARKEATIASQRITNGSFSTTNSSAIISNTESNKFTFSVTDSRGNNVSRTITAGFVNYVVPTCNVDGKIAIDATDTSKANLIFTASGNYFNNTFGAVRNTLTLTYKVKDHNNEVIKTETLTVPDSSISGYAYNYTSEALSITATETITVEVIVVDKIYTITGLSKTLRVLPAFDWDNNDFSFNVPLVTIQGATVPSLIESGYDGIWWYRKWSDGLFECWAYKDVMTAIDTPWGALYTSGPVLSSLEYFGEDWFIARPSINITATTKTNNYGAIVMSGGDANTADKEKTGTVELILPISRLATVYTLNYQVKGRWK